MSDNKLLKYRKPKIKKKKLKLNLFFNDLEFVNYLDENFNEQILLAQGCCGTCFSCSDIVYKKSIRPLEYVLSKVGKIRGISFQWKKTNNSLGIVKNKKQIGVIAQEIEQVYPELVEVAGNNVKVVDYSKLAAVLIEAVKELNRENNLLKKRIETLENKF